MVREAFIGGLIGALLGLVLFWRCFFLDGHGTAAD